MLGCEKLLLVSSSTYFLYSLSSIFFFRDFESQNEPTLKGKDS